MDIPSARSSETAARSRASGIRRTDSGTLRQFGTDQKGREIHLHVQPGRISTRGRGAEEMGLIPEFKPKKIIESGSAAPIDFPLSEDPLA